MSIKRLNKNEMNKVSGGCKLEVYEVTCPECGETSTQELKLGLNVGFCKKCRKVISDEKNMKHKGTIYVTHTHGGDIRDFVPDETN